MQNHRHSYLAIKERQIASKYLSIHDCQVAIAHLTMKVCQIAIDLFSKRERQMTSDYLAMLVMFAHLAIKERQIASEYLAIHDCQIASMSYQKNYSKREYFVSRTWDI